MSYRCPQCQGTFDDRAPFHAHIEASAICAHTAMVKLAVAHARVGINVLAAPGREYTDFLAATDRQMTVAAGIPLPAAPDRGACAVCGELVYHAYPWWTAKPGTPGASPMHEKCAKEWFAASL